MAFLDETGVARLWEKAKEFFALKSHTHSSYVNQKVFGVVKVGSTSIDATTVRDTLTITAGENITLTSSSANKKLTIKATDTKNSAGASDTSEKIFLVGTTAQAGAATTYSHDTAYVGEDGCLYSGDEKVLTTHPTITTSTDTTSTASPSSGGTFTAVDSVTRDANGHVTKVNTKTVTLPSTSVTVDSAFSTTSTNPVQNKIITNYLNSIAVHKIVTFGGVGSGACAITLKSGDYQDVTNIMTNTSCSSRDSAYFTKAADGSIKVIKAGYYEIVFAGLYNAMDSSLATRVKRLAIAKRTNAESATSYTNSTALTFAERCSTWETQKVSWMFYLAAGERISFLVQCEGATSSVTSTFAYMGGYIRYLGS